MLEKTLGIGGHNFAGFHRIWPYAQQIRKSRLFRKGAGAAEGFPPAFAPYAALRCSSNAAGARGVHANLVKVVIATFAAACLRLLFDFGAIGKNYDNEPTLLAGLAPGYYNE